MPESIANRYDKPQNLARYAAWPVHTDSAASFKEVVEIMLLSENIEKSVRDYAKEMELF